MTARRRVAPCIVREVPGAVRPESGLRGVVTPAFLRSEMLPVVQLNDLPRQGLTFEGETTQDIFQCTGSIDPVFVPPLRYAFTLRADGADLVIEGRAEAQFEMPCSRCGRRMPWRVTLDPYLSVEPRDGAATLDLTAQLREDILLALPGYPRCEESNVDPRPCTAAGQFAPASTFVPLVEDAEDSLPPRNPWEELDRFEPGNPPSN